MSDVKRGSVFDTTAFRLGRVGRSTIARFAGSLEPLQLRPRHCGVLELLREGPRHQFEVAEALRVTPSVVVEMIDELEARGAVSRLRDEADRRRQVVEMTPEGRRLHARCVSLARSLDTALLGRLDPGGRAAFVEALRIIADDEVDARAESAVGTTPPARAPSDPLHEGSRAARRR